MEVIDQTLDKLLTAEAEQVLAERCDLEERLSAYEKQFNQVMSTPAEYVLQLKTKLAISPIVTTSRSAKAGRSGRENLW